MVPPQFLDSHLAWWVLLLAYHDPACGDDGRIRMGIDGFERRACFSSWFSCCTGLRWCHACRGILRADCTVGATAPDSALYTGVCPRQRSTLGLPDPAGHALTDEPIIEGSSGQMSCQVGQDQLEICEHVLAPGRQQSAGPGRIYHGAVVVVVVSVISLLVSVSR